MGEKILSAVRSSFTQMGLGGLWLELQASQWHSHCPMWDLLLDVFSSHCPLCPRRSEGNQTHLCWRVRDRVDDNPAEFGNGLLHPWGRSGFGSPMQDVPTCDGVG